MEGVSAQMTSLQSLQGAQHSSPVDLRGAFSSSLAMFLVFFFRFLLTLSFIFVYTMFSQAQQTKGNKLVVTV